ncbi:VOC family protein [Janthinobacterium sp. LB3P112]|uniref:VOC family protein n=1 Tax=Janthinobacterium sp. LB3P112 TaxID=3424196 RepID=UPI003F27102A
MCCKVKVNDLFLGAGDGLAQQALRDEGCNVLEKAPDSEYGQFGWVIDPEGNKVELWQPQGP